MIKIENLHYSYKNPASHHSARLPSNGQGAAVGYQAQEHSDHFALGGINLEIDPGEFIALIGPNGCGKSTLAKHLNGILSPTIGDVWIDNINTKEKDNIWEVRKKVGMVFQNPDHQLVGNIVEEEVAFGPENICLPPSEIRGRVNEALKAIDLYDLKKVPVNMLSGGQKQKVAIASILAMQPNYIVFDEPTTMLDPKTRNEVYELIKKLNEDKKITIIYITHFMEEAVLASRVIVLNDGKIELDGLPHQVFSDVGTLRKLSLDTPPMVGLVHELNKAGMKLPEFLLTPEEVAIEIFNQTSKKGGVINI